MAVVPNWWQFTLVVFLCAIHVGNFSSLSLGYVTMVLVRHPLVRLGAPPVATNELARGAVSLAQRLGVKCLVTMTRWKGPAMR